MRHEPLAPRKCPARPARGWKAARLSSSIFLALALTAAGVAAKLPAPSDEAKAKAAEAAAKAKWSNEVAAFKLCKAQDMVAAEYRAKAGKAASAPMETSPCKEPGPFTYAAADKPLEAAGAHSPARTASEPPNTSTPQAEQKKQ